MAGWLVILTIHAENLISLSSVSGAPNEEVTVSVLLQNSDAVAALQLSIPLDEQLTLVECSAVKGSRASNHDVTMGVKDGVLNVMVYSLSMKALSGTSGEVLSFKLKLGKEPKDIALSPSKTVLTKSNGQQTTSTCQSGSVSIRTAKAQYSSMEVDFGHVPIRDTYTRILSVKNVGNEPLTITALNFSDVNVFSSTTTFPLTIAAGATKSLNVTYKPTERGSVERTMQVVCNSISKLNTITLRADPFAVNELHVQDVSGVSDEEVTIHLTMNNMDAITGFQFEFALPDVLKYVDESFVLSNRKADHTLLTTLNDGVLRAISYSSTNASFTGNDGEIASFRVKLDGRNGVMLNAQKAILTSQIKNVTTDVLSARYGGNVNIKSPRLSINSSINMGKVSITEDCTYTLTIHNYGSASLNISKVLFDNEALNVKETVPMTIGASSSKTLTVVYNSLEEKDFAATMQIYSNDPDQRLVNISVTGSRFAPNYLTLDIPTVPSTDDLQVRVNLDNYDAIDGLQFDVKVPTTIVGKKTVALYQPKTDGVTLTERATGMTVDVRKIDETTVRYFCYFINGKSISHGNGQVMTLTFTPSETLTAGNYQLQVSNIKLGTSGLTDKFAGAGTIRSDFMVKDTYILTYMLNGKSYKIYQVKYGASITAEGAPTKEGYTFSGWSEIPTKMPAKDVTVTGSFTINKYTLTYQVDGQIHKSSNVEYGTAITPEAEPTKEGHTFSGWSEIPATMPAKDVTITGSFTKGKYKLVYMVDGKTYKTISMDYGISITPEKAPEREGYTFSGWSTIPPTMPAKEVVVTGSFTINKYKLTYMVDDKTYKTIEVEYGASIAAESEPVKEGHTFSGWSLIPTTMPAKDVTVTGGFTINKYNLTYMIDGVTYKTSEAEYGTVIKPEAEPSKEGYTFSGWSEIPAIMPAKEVVVTGSFTINKYKLTYKVDDKTYKTIEVEYGASIVAESEPVKEGYSFSGWSLNPTTMPAKDVTVTGSFIINKYNLTYMIDGVTYKTSEVEYGTVIKSEAEPSKEGYTFSGWSEIPAIMPAKDVTVTGSFTKGEYQLTYVVDGQAYKTIRMDYGVVITPEAAPEKDGYTFSGWSEIPATMPAKDVTVTGSFTINKYTLTYQVDGETYKTSEVEYGTSITAEAEPTKEGYSFSGWSLIPTTMPAKDVIITGSFTKGQYKLVYMVDGQTYKTISFDYGAAITPEVAPEREGYTFSGWSEIPAAMPSKDVTVTGSFTINKYTLTYQVDGETYKTYEVEYGTDITAEAEPTKEGYIFSGWSWIPDTMPAEDVTITGDFTFIDAIEDVIADDDEYQIFTLDGKSVETLQRGVNIIRYSNGTTKSVYVK